MAAEVVERTWWSTNSRGRPEDCIVIALHSLLLSKDFTCISLSDEVSLFLFRNADACDVIYNDLYVTVLVHNLMEGTFLGLQAEGTIPTLVVCCVLAATVHTTHNLALKKEVT